MKIKFPSWDGRDIYFDSKRFRIDDGNLVAEGSPDSRVDSRQASNGHCGWGQFQKPIGRQVPLSIGCRAGKDGHLSVGQRGQDSSTNMSNF